MVGLAGGSEGQSKFRTRLAYVVTEDWFFITHFLPVARAARNAGFDIIVVTNITDHRDTIKREGFSLVELSGSRASFSLLTFIRTTLRLRSIFAAERPDVVHAIAIKAIVLAGLAGLFVKEQKRLFSFTGLGYLWAGDAWPKRAARTFLRLTVRVLAAAGSSLFTFENEDDRNEFKSLRDAVVIGGWGLDPEEFKFYLRPRGDVLRLTFLGRMLKAKGVRDAVEAVRLARAQGCNVEIDLWGKPDPGNRTSHSIADLEELSKIPGATWHGAAPNVQDVWARADVAILLSEREGLPRSLIEAAASGLPMIATDVPGCRAIVRKGVDGLLVPCNKPAEAVVAIMKLAADADLRERMGRAAREGFEQRFSTAVVVPKVLELYLRLTQKDSGGLPPIVDTREERNDSV